MRIIALTNQKGGVGKTTSVINIGAGLCELGQKVLLIDLDPQAHLTYSLGFTAHEIEKTVYQLLKAEEQAESIIQKRNGIQLIPANIDLSGAEVEMISVAGREFLLKENIVTLVNTNYYDYMLLDCPPSLGLLTLNALTTATEVFIPLQTEYLALNGLSKLLQTIDIVKKRLNPGIEITGIIATRYDSRKKLNNEVVDKIREHFGDKLFPTLIRDNISLAEAPSFGKTIFEYKPDSNGAVDYLNICKEILNRKTII
jgi:chromosome partitioning protein